MNSIEHLIDNDDGWRLSLSQTWDDDHFVTRRRPVLIVPGYGMNSFIFSYHPTGLSLEGYLARAGFEVWRVNLRAQGRSVSTGGGDDFRLEDLALTDLDVAIRAALARSRTGADRADILGASLGGTIMFIHAALAPAPRLGSLVAMGSPVRSIDIHPLMKLVFVSPTLAGLVRFRGTRKLAEVLVPHVLKRTPWLLSIYMNATTTELHAVREMVKTVEDPNRHINREIAYWLRDRDLIIRGTNVSEALRSISNPLFCVVALADGIVPRSTAEFSYTAVASRSKELLTVGTDTLAMAHADLFVSDEAHARVFAPLAKWLIAQNESTPPT